MLADKNSSWPILLDATWLLCVVKMSYRTSADAFGSRALCTKNIFITVPEKSLEPAVRPLMSNITLHAWVQIRGRNHSNQTLIDYEKYTLSDWAFWRFIWSINQKKFPELKCGQALTFLSKIKRTLLNRFGIIIWNQSKLQTPIPIFIDFSYPQQDTLGI